MDTKVLEYMIAISTERNISRVAEQYYLSQPSMSRCLNMVESTLGKKLFYRKNNKLFLTDAGKIYINNAQAILHIEQQMLNDLTHLREDKRKRVKVIIDHYSYFFFSRNIIPSFYKVQPEYQIELLEGNGIISTDSLKNGFSDIAIITSNRQLDKALEYQILYKDEIVMAAPASLRDSEEARCALELGPKAFQEHRFFLERTDNAFRDMEREIFLQYQFQPNMIYEVSTPSAALQMVVDGYGIAFLPRSLAEARMDKLLVYSLDPIFHFNIYAAYQKGLNMQRPVKLLFKILLDEYCKSNEFIFNRHNEI